jgi:hypothetical protein
MGEVQVPCAPPGRHRYIESVDFERPRTVEGWRTTPAGEYDVEIRLNSGSAQEACEVGLSCLGEVVAALSFLGSAPVEIVNAAVTDSPGGTMKVELVDSPGKTLDISLTGSAGPEPGREYTVISFGELFGGWVAPTALPAGHAAFLFQRKPERVVRALRWIQRSHFTDSPLDEFTHLMIAFESLSHLLKDTGMQYWHCDECSRDVVACPLCGASTESKKTGGTAMREFVASLGWSNKEWRAIWGRRAKILHGEADISLDEEHAIREGLPKLEEAVIAAVKTVAGLPDDHPPTHPRHRPPFSDPRLVIKWRV